MKEVENGGAPLLKQPSLASLKEGENGAAADAAAPQASEGNEDGPISLNDIKHYRRYYPDELEKIREVMEASPFMAEKIYRMKTTGGSMFSSVEEKNVSFEVGYFKGLVKVYNLERKKVRSEKISEA